MMNKERWMILKIFLVGKLNKMTIRKKKNFFKTEAFAVLVIVIVLAVAAIVYFSYVYEKPEPQLGFFGPKTEMINDVELEVKKSYKEEAQSPPGSGNKYTSRKFDGFIDDTEAIQEGIYKGKYVEYFPSGKKKIDARYQIHNGWGGPCKSASQSGAEVGGVTNKYMDIGGNIHWERRCITLSKKYTEWEEYGNGKTRKKIQANFKGGLMHGKAITYVNGKKKSIDKWVDGFKDGVFVRLADDGVKVSQEGENEVETVEKERLEPNPTDSDMPDRLIPAKKGSVPAAKVVYNGNPFREVGPEGEILDYNIVFTVDSKKVAEALNEEAITGEPASEYLSPDFGMLDPTGTYPMGPVLAEWVDEDGNKEEKIVGNFAPVPSLTPGGSVKEGKFDETVFPSQKSNEQVLNELRNAVHELIAAAGSEEEAPFVDIAVDEGPQTDPEQDIIDPVPKKLDITYKKGDEVLVEGEAVDPRNDEVVASVESPRTVDPVTREKILTGKQVARASLSVGKKFPYNIHGFGGRGTLFVNPDIAQSGKRNVIWEYTVEKDRAYKDLKYWLKVRDPDTGTSSHKLWMESEKGKTLPSYPLEMHLGGEFKQYSTVTGRVIAEGQHEFGSRARLWKFRKAETINGVDYNPVKRLHFYEDDAWSPNGYTLLGTLCWYANFFVNKDPAVYNQPYRLVNYNKESRHCKDPPSYNLYNHFTANDLGFLTGDY